MLVETIVYDVNSGAEETGYINPNNVELAIPFTIQPLPDATEQKAREALRLIFGSGRNVYIVASLTDYNLMCSSMMTQTGAILEQGRQHYHAQAQASRIINPNGVL